MHWCDRCVKSMIGQEAYSCRRCGARLSQPIPFEDGCQVCRSTRIRFDEALSIGNYGGMLQQIVREMKRAKSEPAATQLGRLIAKLMIEQEVGKDADAVVSLPVHWWKRLVRGFNAASVIADGLSQNFDVPRISALRFVRQTKKQGTLTTTARIANVKGAVAVVGRQRVLGKHVILVDDVATSCATANEATRALIQAGATKVTLVVAARGVRG